jgi:mycoredoxin
VSSRLPAENRAQNEASTPFTVYSTPWCGYCTRLKKQLKREAVSFAEVDIEEDPAAEVIVKAVNGGNATVPTLVFADGSSLTNPSVREVLAKVSAAA